MLRFAVPDLSIVLTARDAERLIDIALANIRTIIATLGLNTEVIVVDDASTDATATRAEAHDDDFVSLRVLQCDRPGGPGRAARLGMMVASGRRRVYLAVDRVDTLAHLAPMLDQAGEFEEDSDVIVGPLTLFGAHAADDVFPRCRLDGPGLDIEALAIARTLEFSVLSLGGEPDHPLSIFERARVRSRLRDLRQHADAGHGLRI